MDELLKISRDRVSGSMAEIVLSSASSTQTAPAPTATLEGATAERDRRQELARLRVERLGARASSCGLSTTVPNNEDGSQGGGEQQHPSGGHQCA